MHADSVQVDIWFTLCFMHKWENLKFINMPFLFLVILYNKLSNLAHFMEHPLSATASKASPYLIL